MSTPEKFARLTDRQDPTASRALVTDANQRVTASAVTATELGYLSGVTSAIQTQLDTILVNLDWKPSAQLATTANVTLSGEQTIDGVLTSSSRILVKNQTAGAENGIYVTAAGSWTRATDFDADAEVTSGASVFISEGTANGGEVWQLTTADPITVGTTAQTWAQLLGSGSGGTLPQSEPGTGNFLFGTDAGASLTSGTYNVAIGEGAGFGITSNGFNVAIGYNALYGVTTGFGNVCVGRDSGKAITTGQGNVFIGDNIGATNTTGNGNCIIGSGTTGKDINEGNFNIIVGGGGDPSGDWNVGFNTILPTTYSSCVGFHAGANWSADGQIAFGQTGDAMDDLYGGTGIISTSPSAFSINASGGNGTDVAGADLNLNGGKGTGNADSGAIRFKTSDAGGTGTTLQSLTEKGRLDKDGYWVFKAQTSAISSANLDNNTFSFHYDSGGPQLVITHKDGSGTVRTGTIALA